MKTTPVIISLMIVAGITAWSLSHPDQADAAPYHQRVAAMVDSLPFKVGAWEGSDTGVPPAATALLKPNALLSRTYINAADRDSASLVVIHCRDTRDMAGHFPPICYPAHGWQNDDDEWRQPVTLDVGGETVDAIRYEFTRSSFTGKSRIVIYSFFALPDHGIARDMDAIRAAADDYRARPFGAAQFQIILSPERTVEREMQIASELLAPTRPLIDAIVYGSERPEQ